MIRRLSADGDTDIMGAVAAGLCLIHCIATPFIFIAQACSVSCCSAAPGWWRGLDYAFLIISAVAVYYSTRNSSTEWIKVTLWSSWIGLFLIIINNILPIQIIPDIPFIQYVPALGLVGFHIINLKFCKCKDDSCCAV